MRRSLFVVPAAVGLALAGLTVTTPGRAGGLPADLQLTSLNITVSNPLAVRHAGDGSGRLFIVEREGTIQVYREDSGLAPAPFLDIRSEVDTFFEGGLLGLAFHPDFASNGLFYINYTRDGSGSNSLETVIERFTVSSTNPDQANLSSRETILTVNQPAGNHNGGDLLFGLDGLLYIALGDGGATSSTSQNGSELLGKMLRIAPCDTATCASPYTIPAGNPNVGTAEPDEIWTSGFRNPYRFSIDRDTGDFFIADVGEGSREEVSFAAADAPGGDNYGWNCREGDIPGPGGCSGTFVEPILTYPHTAGKCSITGGYRYRGCIEGLQGSYVYGDFCTGEVFVGTEDSPGSWSAVEWDDLPGNIFGFGEDEDGELYIVVNNDVSRFESPSSCQVIQPDTVFLDGFEN